MTPGVVIVGTGQGGFQTAVSLRSEGYDGPITLIGEEPHLPYQRPPLSKGFLAGKQQAHHVTLRPAPFYGDHQIELLAGEQVIELDRTRRRVQLSSGAQIPYKALVLAVGASIRKLTVPGADLDGVCYLRTFDDSTDLKARLLRASEVIVIGGGFIGLEFAAVARSQGKPVTVVEVQPRLMARAVSPVISETFEILHGGHGVEFVYGIGVSEIMGTAGRVGEIVLSDGTRRKADLVVAGIGVLPNMALARHAGLAVDNGVVVDEYLRTSDENIYAIGDCAEHPNSFAGGRTRLESVQNAVDQAACAAAAIAGRASPYCEVPWFWTEQYDVKLQMAGLSAGYESAIPRGTPESRKFSVFYFRGERLIAVDSVNRPGDHLAARKLLASAASLTPAQAADEGFDLKTHR
jgi:3-phenylpropionate/trans-cinnamate dioxygenase ferredoxin reductase subunit